MIQSLTLGYTVKLYLQKILQVLLLYMVESSKSQRVRSRAANKYISRRGFVFQ
ncbi:unnamed protein product, partial [Arabidopsis halleri]